VAAKHDLGNRRSATVLRFPRRPKLRIVETTVASEKAKDDRQCAVIALRVLQFYRLPKQEMSLDTGLILHGMVQRCIWELNNAGTLEERLAALEIDLDWHRWFSIHHEDGRKRAKHFHIYERYLGVLDTVNGVEEAR
jgi:hypothetical protein